MNEHMLSGAIGYAMILIGVVLTARELRRSGRPAALAEVCTARLGEPDPSVASSLP
jgi:hypothetical protein